jgi:RNase P subunit RPR2
MSHPATTNYQERLCSIPDLSPQLAALYLSRHRISNPQAITAPNFCVKCGSQLRTRLHRRPKQTKRDIIYDCATCGYIRRMPVSPAVVGRLPITGSNEIVQDPVPEQEEVRATSPVQDAKPTKEPPREAIPTPSKTKKKQSHLQQMLAKNREQQNKKPHELGLSSFLQQL